MPLSPAKSRQQLHVRKVVCQGYFRSDGLWDIEGHLGDFKTYSFSNEERGTINPGEPVDGMSIRLTVDDDFLIHDVEAVTDYSPYSICGNIAKNFRQLKGLRIGTGWRKQIQKHLGNIHGCTHLVELLGPIATTAYQTIYSARVEKREGNSQNVKLFEMDTKTNSNPPKLLNTCYAFND